MSSDPTPADVSQTREPADAARLAEDLAQERAEVERLRSILVAKDAELGIRTEAWSPIGRGGEVFSDSVVTGIAAAHGRTPAQVVLRWHVQLGTVPLPKAASAARQAENLAVFDFELSEDEMTAITVLGRPDGRLFGADPASHEEM